MKKLSQKIYVVLIALTMLLATSCGKNSSSTNTQVPGVNGPHVNFDSTNGTLLISAVFDFVLDGGARVSPITRFPKSYIEIGPDLQSEGTLFAINLDIMEILNADPNMFDPQTLPGGRALPGLTSGKLPGFAMTVPKLKNLSFYLGQKLFGVFFPAPMMNKMKNSIATFRFKAGGSRIGNLSLVGGDSNGENGGFLLMLDLDAATKSRLKKLLKRNHLN